MVTSSRWVKIFMCYKKSRKMAENLQKAFNDNNTVESRTKQMAKYVSSVKEIYVSDIGDIELYQNLR